MERPGKITNIGRKEALRSGDSTILSIGNINNKLPTRRHHEIRKRTKHCCEVGAGSPDIYSSRGHKG